MSDSLPMAYLVRHGETAWSLTGQHTGLTDLPLTERGEEHARRLGPRLQELCFDCVLVSPLQRAMRTCALAGYGDIAKVDPDLVEWNYGDYEGRRTVDIHKERPDWLLSRDGCPGGESPEDVQQRADRVIARIRAFKGHVLIFSSGHIFRMLATRWLGLDPIAARYLLLGTGSISALGYDRVPELPAIQFWNVTEHLSD